MKRGRFFPSAFHRELCPGCPDRNRLAADLIPEHRRCVSVAQNSGLPAECEKAGQILQC